MGIWVSKSNQKNHFPNKFKKLGSLHVYLIFLLKEELFSP